MNKRITKFGFPPLYFAFSNCSCDSAKILINNGADPTLKINCKDLSEYWGKSAKEIRNMDEQLIQLINDF